MENFKIIGLVLVNWICGMIEKDPYESYNKRLVLQACNFIKKRFQHSCFLVKFAKIFRKQFFTEHLQWLLLFPQI